MAADLDIGRLEGFGELGKGDGRARMQADRMGDGGDGGHLILFAHPFAFTTDTS